ncbi:ribonuclease T2 family protein [Proteus faecis]|uniref:ribonuclease T2 family protein n=1 Tax=Proteus faecis TaxID=2050967 RepID=UPI00257A058D|nr:ribonuclease [Proteus faecis]MDM3868258.1 ribonuclease [Proteus faecis]
MRFMKLLPATFALVLAGCATQAPEITEPLKPQAKLVEGVSCIVPDAPTAPYDYIASNDRYGQNSTASTDYFKLAINYSPAFCDYKSNNIKRLNNDNEKDRAKREYDKFEIQCFSDNKFGWIVHGLWAETCDGKSWEECRDWKDIRKHPRLCKGDLPPLEYSTIKPYLCDSPGIDLLQGEWEKHGVCAFDTPDAFFGKQKELYEALVLPEGRPSNSALIKFLKEHNPSLKDKEIQINRDEFYICYSKDFEVIDCPKREF